MTFVFNRESRITSATIRWYSAQVGRRRRSRGRRRRWDQRAGFAERSVDGRAERCDPRFERGHLGVRSFGYVDEQQRLNPRDRRGGRAPASARPRRPKRERHRIDRRDERIEL